jgi:aquaporin rerated protein, other eukaryote
MCISGQLPWIRGAFLFPAQMVAGMAAAAVVKGIFPGPFNALTTLTNGTSIAQGVFIEMFLTAELIITVLMLAAEKTKATFVAPVGIGLSLFVAELTGMLSLSYPCPVSRVPSFHHHHSSTCLPSPPLFHGPF